MEAISRKKEVDEMKTMAKEIGVVSINRVGLNHTFAPSLTAEGWEFTTTGAGNNVCVNRQYFDLKGLALDDKTLFFSAATVQETLLPSSAPAVAGNGFVIVDVMSNHPITNSQANVILTNGNIDSISASGGSGLTFDQTIYMRHRIFNTDIDNLAGGYTINLSNNQLGSLSPTASDRVYVTRIVSLGGGDGNYTVYPCRFVLRAEAKEEPEYEYMMRLKRSYELQNEPDND